MRLLRLLKHDLSAATLEWIAKDIISKNQGEKILDLYGAKLPQAGENQNRGYMVLMSLASLMICLAIIVVIGANWEEIPRWIRMTVMILVVVVCNFIGWYKYRQNDITSATVALFMGSMLYGAAIMLIAQIYHLGEHYPNGILLWTVGVLPVALIIKSRAIILLASILSFIWVVLEFEMGYIPLSYLLFLTCSFYFSIKLKPSLIVYLLSLVGFVTFFEYITALLVYGNFHGSPVSWGVANVFYSSAVLLILLRLSTFIKPQRFKSHIIDYALVTRIWAFRLGIIFLFILSFEKPLSRLLENATKIPTASILFGAGTSLLMIILYLTQSIINKKFVINGSIIIEALASLLLLLLSFESLWYDSGHIIPLVLAINLMLLFCGLFILIDGMHMMNGAKFHAGLAIILALSICRYVDLIGDYLGGAAIFAIAGLIMVLAAKYWEKFKQDNKMKNYE